MMQEKSQAVSLGGLGNLGTCPLTGLLSLPVKWECQHPPYEEQE